MARGNNGQKTFIDNTDYANFLEVLRKTKARYPFKIYAYVLMPNHLHMLIEVQANPSAVIMQSVLTGYARYFNIRHKRRGHLFQGRYKAIVCQQDAYLMVLMSYIHMNPVRAKLVASPQQWQWSGHQDYLGKVKEPIIDRGVVTELLGQGSAGMKKYQHCISDGIGREYMDDLHPAENSPFLGSDTFVDSFIRGTDDGKPKKSIEELTLEIAKRNGVSVRAVCGADSDRIVTQVRKDIVLSAVCEYGHEKSAVARYLQCDPSYVTRVVQREMSKCQV
jgi:REP element-mobilizing transposase RayT